MLGVISNARSLICANEHIYSCNH